MRVEDIPWEATRAPEPPAPPLADLWQGRAGRWLRYHVAERLTGNAEVALFRLLALLPPALSARVGRTLGGTVARLDRHRPYVAFMRRGIRAIRPDLDPGAAEGLLAAWFREAGTTHALYPVLDRLARTLAVVAPERLAEADAAPRPTFFLLVHLGSWELMANVIAERLRRPVVAVWEPQPSRHQNRLIQEARRRKGIRAFPPSRLLPRLLIPLIEGGCNAVFFVDEVSEGETKFPHWGRAVPERSNLVFALKLAQRTGARLQPAFFLRGPEGAATLHLPPPVETLPGPDRAVYVRETATALSALIEPVIAANLAQWYMLKDLRLPTRGR